MRIIIAGNNYENYYAKVHQAYRTGLKALFDTKCYGHGWPEYDKSITSFLEIKDVLFGNLDIDLILLTDCWDTGKLEEGFFYSDLYKLKCKKAIMLCDFWSEANNQMDKYINFIEDNNIDYIFSYSRAPFHIWKQYKQIYNKLVWFPPSFDPHIFNDWQLDKKWDVGNLNAAIFKSSQFYPERYKMHLILSQMSNIKYYFEKHPGTGIVAPDTPLIGKSFSEAINQCRIFVTSGNLTYKNFAPKYVEAMASKTCLFAYEPIDSEMIGLVDGVNYVRINETNLEKKVYYYLEHEQERNMISENGYQLVMSRYTCYSQAINMYKELKRITL